MLFLILIIVLGYYYTACKDSANRTKNQIYLDFSEMQPLQRHTLREFFPCEKDSEYFAQNEEIYEFFWKSQKKFLSLQHERKMIPPAEMKE
jgi:hypothetical protein